MHQPVLYKEIIHALQPKSEGRYLDGTLGAGGHAFGILEHSEPAGQLLGLDVDPEALDIARERLAGFGDRARIVRSSYLKLDEQLAQIGWDAVDGIVLDFGVSSMQLDRPARGFSFRTDAPLDMRFDPGQPTTAADLVNELPENDLADILFRYGEERGSRRIARAIVEARPISTTRQLADVITRIAKSGKIHPATKTFQALRIATNRELEAVAAVLPLAVGALKPGGRLAVISFHSLEDRIVKQYFQRESQDCICPPEQWTCTCGHEAVLDKVSKKPVIPQAEEIRQNPRARSARLRIIEKRK